MRKIFSAKLFAFCLLLVCACDKKDISYKYPDNPDYLRKSRAGSLSKKGALVLYNGGEEKNDSAIMGNITIGDSALWKSAIEVVEILAPIASVDSDNGVIASAWHQADKGSSGNSGTNRSKINVIIKGPQIKSENVEVIVFYQKKVDGVWQSDGSDNSASFNSIAAMLQEKILARAKDRMR